MSHSRNPMLSFTSFLPLTLVFESKDYHYDIQCQEFETVENGIKLKYYYTHTSDANTTLQTVQDWFARCSRATASTEPLMNYKTDLAFPFADKTFKAAGCFPMQVDYSDEMRVGGSITLLISTDLKSFSE